MKVVMYELRGTHLYVITDSQVRFILDTSCKARVLYQNWKGEVSWRHISPLELPPQPPSGSHPFHPNEWTFKVWDWDKMDIRDFCFKDILRWEKPSEPLRTTSDPPF